MEGHKDFSLAKVIGKALILASIQSALGSVEMSSKFSIINFAKDQDTLQNGMNALTSYIVVAIVWTIGSACTLYANYGVRGAFWAFTANMIMLLWIVISYLHAFKKAADSYNLEYPDLFHSL